jgi:hypothetical protein
MREDCRHFESRVYDSGEAARSCVLGLAPEQPWRCPDDCTHYERTVIDGTFIVGDLALAPVEAEPDDTPDNVEGVLADAEAIVEAVELDAILEVERGQRGRRRWWPFGTRRGGDDGDDVHLSNR